MSLHPSLKSSRAGKKLRSVLKRYEKFFTLKEKGILKDDSSIFGMPKLKIVRTKIKKEKAEEKPKEGEVVAGGTATATGADAKATGAKGAEKTATKKETAPKADKEKGKKGK